MLILISSSLQFTSSLSIWLKVQRKILSVQFHMSLICAFLMLRPKMVLKRKFWSLTAGCTPLGTFLESTKGLAQEETK